MLRLYYVKNDNQCEILDSVNKLGFKAALVGTDGLVLQYDPDNEEKIKEVVKLIQHWDNEQKDLGIVTIDWIERFKNVPFACFDPVEMRKYFGFL